MSHRTWVSGGKPYRLLGLAFSVLLASCTELRNSGNRPDAIDTNVDASPDRDASMMVDGPRMDARRDGDAFTDVATATHLVLDKTSQDFGMVLLSTVSAAAEFVVKNDGGVASGTLTVTLTGIPAGFSVMTDDCNGKSLPAGASCHVVVIFTPAAAGKVTGSVKLSAPGFDATATLAAEGITPGALKIAPPTQDFGSVVPPARSLSQTFTITNMGQQKSGLIKTALSGTDAASFEVTADGCSMQALGAQQACQITVRFAPPMMTLGTKSISLTVSADPGGSAIAQLSGAAITPGNVVIMPGSFDLGSVQQGMAGMSKQFTMQNKGQATTALLSAAISTADFSIAADTCTGKTLAANATCTLTVRFNPTTAGSKLATLSLTELAGGTATAQLSGTSLANPSLRLAPATKDFNSVAMGTDATVMFQVFNDGDIASSAPMATIAPGTDAAQFSIPPASNGCTTPVAAKSSCMLAVRFAPTTTGLKGAMLSVTAAAGGTTTASLVGTGILPGVLALNLSTFDFHGIQQGTVSTVATFTVTNKGQTTTGPVTARIVGSAVFTIVSNLCNQITLGPANTCSLTVRFEPAAPGPVSGTLEITATPGSTTTASLSGTGLAPAALVINPTALTFGTTVVGATSAVQNFTVTNNGGVAAGTTTQLAGALGRTDAADFKIVTSNCAGMLAAGNSCMLVVAFAPKTAGDKTASISVTATPGGNAVAAIAGTAQSAARLTVTAASGSSTAYGNVPLATMSDKTFVVTNTGDQTSSALGVSLTAATGSGFTLLAPTTGQCAATTTLAGGASCSVGVRFAPTVAGMQTATLSANATTGGTASLGLTGNGQRGATLSGTTSNNFGTVVIGSTTGTVNWTVSNTGDVATGMPTLLPSGDVVITSNGCATPIAGNTSCVIGVAFRAAASGARTGTATLSATPGGSVTFTATANGQAVAGLALAPAAGSVTNFGNVLVGANLIETFLLTNTGQQPTTAVTVALTTTATSGFAVVVPPATGECVTGTTVLAGGASCAIRVRFTPTGPGMQTATLAASATTGGTATPLALVANGQRPALLSGTTTNPFGSVVVGFTSDPFVWNITNAGDVATNVPVLTPTSELVVMANTCNVAIPGLGRCMISVSFRPSAGGARTGMLTLAATPAGGSVTLMASATGLTVAALALSPVSAATFGNVQAGMFVEHTFVLTNTGQQPSTAVTVALTTDAGSAGYSLATPAVAGDCVSGVTTLPTTTGPSCNIRVRFTAPTSPGIQTATLGASAATGGIAPPLSLTGNAQRPPQLTGTTSKEFGLLAVGSTSDSVLWTITNGGDAPTSVPAVPANSNPMEVQVTQNGCTAALLRGATCTMMVAFHPIGIDMRMGAVTLSATAGGSVTFTATATGQMPADLTLLPRTTPPPASQVDFGSPLINGGTQDEYFIATNGGGQPTSAITVGLSPPGTDFTIQPVGTDCVTGAILAAGGTCTIHVQFHPLRAAPQTVLLGVSAMTGGMGSLTLKGQGQMPAALTLSVSPTGPQAMAGVVDLGPVMTLGSATATFVLANTGDQLASGITTGLTQPPGDFTVLGGDSSDCGATLAGRTTCEIRVAFSPRVAGTASTMLSVGATVGGMAVPPTFGITGTGM